MKKMTFYEIYQERKAQRILPDEQLLQEVAKLCGVTETTVKIWLVGKVKPTLKFQIMIGKHFNVDYESLFPDYKGLTAQQFYEQQQKGGVA